MELQNKDHSRFVDIVQSLARALDLAISRDIRQDSDVDAIVAWIDDAIDTIASRTFTTPADGELIESLEGLILKLRVRDASTAPGGRPSDSADPRR